MSDLLSFRQYAKRRGVSPEAVSKAVETGRISTVLDAAGKRKIDPAKADAQWELNTSKAMQRKPTAPARPPVSESPDPAPTAGAGPSYAQSRAIREAYAARLAKLEFEEKSEKLVEVDKVKVEAFRTARIVRDAILAVADRIDAELAVLNDRNEINRVLKTELVRALEDLANAQ